MARVMKGYWESRILWILSFLRLVKNTIANMH